MGRIYGRQIGWAYIEILNKIIRVRVIPGGTIMQGVIYLSVIPYSKENGLTEYFIESKYTAKTKKIAFEKLQHLIK